MPVLVLVLVLQAGGAAVPTRDILISASYPSSLDVERMKEDLAKLRQAGFNSVTTSIAWRDGEPRQGAYNLLPLDRVVAVAAAEGLRVRIDVRAEPEPEWKRDGTNALAGQFFDYVRRRFAAHPAVWRVSPAQPSGAVNRVIVGAEPGSVSPREARREMWNAIAGGAREFEFVVADGAGGPLTEALLSLGEAAGVITRNQALFAPLRPVRFEAGEVEISTGRISVHLLDSAEAMAIVALNHASNTQKAVIRFPPRIPEAIWQDMEGGASVHFAMTAGGPALERTFAPHDVLVLAIRKTLR